LTAPLPNLQLIFGFFDRRFPGFNGGREHLGVDFAASAGTPVSAVCDGTVITNNTREADIVTAVVIVEHDCPQPPGAVYGYYGHVHSGLLIGEAITAGSTIGTVRDWGGNSHLHLGLSTRLMEENWGVVPRGATLQTLTAEGWLNPLDYFLQVTPRKALPYKSRPPTPRMRGKKPSARVRR
jgi:murein DD-endopeptidase MepM/ murein hydrolase activator NlpD